MLKNKFSKVILIVAALALILLAVFLLLKPKPQLQSLRVQLDDVQKITAPSSGKVQFIALPGQIIRAGDVLLRLDVAKDLEQAHEYEEKIKELAASVPGRYGSLMSAYLSIPQNENELAEELQAARENEKLSQEELERQSSALAAFSLEVRKLELKKDKLPAEQETLRAKLAEEEQLRGYVNLAYKAHEQASLHRASLEKDLSRKQNLARSLSSAPPAAQESLLKMAEVFSDMYALEQRILLSFITAPQNGIVIFTALSEADSINAGDPAIYFLPSSSTRPGLTAWFTKKDANKISISSKCLVNLTKGTTSIELEGVVGERLPFADTGADSEVPFRIEVPSLKKEQLAGVNPETEIRVTITN